MVLNIYLLNIMLWDIHERIKYFHLKKKSNLCCFQLHIFHFYQTYYYNILEIYLGSPPNLKKKNIVILFRKFYMFLHALPPKRKIEEEEEKKPFVMKKLWLFLFTVLILPKIFLNLKVALQFLKMTISKEWFY